MKRLLTMLIALLFTQLTHAATVDTVNIYSQAMKKEFKCVVIQPSQDKQEPKLFPVVYLLHGYGGWYANWVIRVPQLKDYAEQFKIIIVCPDGANSWYIDSPVDPAMQYETYIGKEVPDFIETRYPAISDRKARAITGLSMGGFGGLYIGFRNAARFGACGSMSGGVDLNYSRNKYDVSKRIGDTLKYADNWINYSMPHIIETYPKDSLAIIFDCGTEDFFFKDNHALHEKMMRLKIPHEYTERPGKHDWNYWRNSVQYQLLFFANYFYPRK